MATNIEVRMWSKDANKYFYGNGAMDCLLQQNRHDSPDESHGLGHDHISGGMVFEQFTGLIDMNGNKIYQGDLIKINFGIPPTSLILKVEWCDGTIDGTPCVGWWYMELQEDSEHIQSAPASATYQDSVEVVGNIHENKELFPCEHGIPAGQNCLLCVRPKGGLN
jgi:uncharacterized phage protein (TIGR01671 family)